MSIDPRTPVLVGVAQYVDRERAPGEALGPADMLAAVAGDALADAGCAASAIDTVVVTRLFADSSPAFASPFGSARNYPHALARRIGTAPAREIYGPVGGNTPQMFVNIFADEIARGICDVVLLAGCEPLRTQSHAARAGIKLDWAEDAPADPLSLEPDKQLVSRHELAHGIALPVNVYPLFENALGHAYGRTPEAHRAAIGRLMQPFTEVASHNPFAALPVARSGDELVTPTADNRFIAYPYTKYLVSNMFVDQAAAVLLMSTAAADRLGVSHDRRVYLHGSADVNERILVSDRVDFTSSPAIRLGAAQALAQAGATTATLAHIELYSCFPVAVEIAADMIGFAHDDPRGLTLTGGLPYFGGPGNNYSMHGIAEMVARCRAAPGSTGLVFANGGYLTKHSFGVYSTTPGYNGRRHPAALQRQVDALAAPAVQEKPNGPGRVETFTVVHDRGRPAFAIIVGRLDASSHRFLAQMHDGLDALIDRPVIGRAISVTAGDPVNMAHFTDGR